ncbi:LysR family transcriptional regulator [Acidisoma cellulosilytica]|uniref:LysR family transcriptional regulator n=1 Tax=Acidisoma cellulosilyticum TaxID=2802395 RepID=A0A963Z304_9PROT|nr:LysR family transcriptional regulator [Acidisoma cellulosilyticum]MCB8880955.1 LysR family transcriptional regulator [Acidisoma cellulosilyticum]
MRHQLSLEQLRIFVAAAERQHMTRAAEALNLAQSAVSGAIANLEQRYGTKLFHRVGRGIALTEAGGLFLPEAQAVLARAERAELVLSELGDLKRGTLTVQASQTIASYWLPRFLVQFRQAHPGVEIKLSIGNTAQVAAAVHEGTAELGFIEGAINDPALIAEEVARDQLVTLVSPNHPWLSAESLTLDQLADGPWVLREQGSGTRSAFEAAMSSFGIFSGSLKVLLELPSNEAVRAAVEAGLGATALSASVAAPSLEAGLLQTVDLKLPDRPFYVLRRTERYLSRAAEALITIIDGTARRSLP